MLWLSISSLSIHQKNSLSFGAREDEKKGFFRVGASKFLPQVSSVFDERVVSGIKW